MSRHTIWGPSIILRGVSGNDASFRDLFPLESHSGLFSSTGTVCDFGGVRKLLLLHHGKATAGRIGAVIIDALKFGAGIENNANSLALCEIMSSGPM
jgi:hypothetical protein